LYDLVCPEAEDPPTLSFHHLSSTIVRFDLKGVVLAVNFDHELSRHTGKIGKVRPNRVLAPEFNPAQTTIAQQFPADALRPTAIAPELTSSLDGVVGHPSPNLSSSEGEEYEP